MHDSTAAITAMKTQVEPLARRLDTISKHPEASLSKQEVAAIKREIDMMSNALDAAAKSGRANGVFADRSLLGAAKDVLNEVKGKITNARSEISNASLRNFADKVFYTPNIKILETRFMSFLKVVAPVLATAVEARERLCTAAKDYARKPDKENLRRLKQHRDAFAAINEKDLRQSIQNLLVYTHKDKVENGGTIKVALNANSVTTKIREDMTNLGGEVLTDEMEADLNEFVSLLLAFRDNTKKAFKEHKTSPMHEIDAVYYHPKGVAAQAAHLELMGKNANSLNDLKFQTNGTVLAAFEGKLRFTTLVEARLRGIDDGDVDPSLDDINVESSKTLGSGKVNTVYEVTCKDGSKHIFKPEAEGRKAIESIFLTFGMDNMQMIVGLNMASQKVADALGLDDVMTKTTVGSHKGSFGMFMEKAPGVTADDWSNPSKSEKLPAGQLSPAGIKGLYDEEYAIVVGGLMRKANRLEWFDLITGQGDRHPANYMMSVNQLDNSVTLKGIDNDACFPAYRKGIRTFALDVPNTQKFKEQLLEIAKELYPDKGPEAVNQQDPGLAARFVEDLFNRDPAITKNKDGSITVDTTKAASPLIAVALMNAIGLQTTALPDYIDEELYNHLMELGRSGQARKTFIAGMKAHLSPAAADAAVKRLDEAVALAKRLARENKVISKMDWFDANVQFELVGKINRRGNGFKKIPKVVEGYPDFSEKGEKKVAAKYKFVSNGYFRRDIVLPIAKRGWFDE